jgi:hypothetical protein
MIIISKEQRDLIQAKFPNVNIVRAKHHYYCEEDHRVMRMLGKEPPVAKKRDNQRNNRKWRNNDR